MSNEQNYIQQVEDANELVEQLKQANAEGRLDDGLINKAHKMHNNLANKYANLNEENKARHREKFAMLTVQLVLGNNPAFYLSEGLRQLQDELEALRAQRVDKLLKKTKLT